MDLQTLITAALPADITLHRALGAGGQGAVFLATRGGINVALKAFMSSTDQRIDREIESLKAVTCPHLVKMLDSFTIQTPAGPIPIVLYELVEGQDLRAHINSADVISESGLRKLGYEIGLAIEALWDKRTVHRDIKPDNIMYDTAKSRYVLVDIGLAQHLNLSTITTMGQPGTNGYRSPEQCGGRRRLTTHSDVFSFGMTLFEVAAKQHPWGHQQAMIGITVPHPPLSALRPDLSVSTVSAIQQMIRSKPFARPTSPSALFYDQQGF